MEDDKVKKLAETLYNQGLAVSMYEATEKAKSILNIKSTKQDQKQQEPVKSEDEQKKPVSNQDNVIEKEDVQEKQGEIFSNQDLDLKRDVPLNELMKEAGVDPEQVETQENTNEEVSLVIEENVEKEEPKKEETQEASTEINETIEEKTEEQESGQSQEDKGNDVPEKSPQTEKPKTESKEDKQQKEENSIDLSKVFNYGK